MCAFTTHCTAETPDRSHTPFALLALLASSSLKKKLYKNCHTLYKIWSILMSGCEALIRNANWPLLRPQFSNLASKNVIVAFQKCHIFGKKIRKTGDIFDFFKFSQKYIWVVAMEYLTTWTSRRLQKSSLA